jgi:hypothetical protein
MVLGPGEKANWDSVLEHFFKTWANSIKNFGPCNMRHGIKRRATAAAVNGGPRQGTLTEMEGSVQLTSLH